MAALARSSLFHAATRISRYLNQPQKRQIFTAAIPHIKRHVLGPNCSLDNESFYEMYKLSGTALRRVVRQYGCINMTKQPIKEPQVVFKDLDLTTANSYGLILKLNLKLPKEFGLSTVSHPRDLSLPFITGKHSVAVPNGEERKFLAALNQHSLEAVKNDELEPFSDAVSTWAELKSMNKKVGFVTSNFVETALLFSQKYGFHTDFVVGSRPESPSVDKGAAMARLMKEHKAENGMLVTDSQNDLVSRADALPFLPRGTHIYTALTLGNQQQFFNTADHWLLYCPFYPWQILPVKDTFPTTGVPADLVTWKLRHLPEAMNSPKKIVSFDDIRHDFLKGPELTHPIARQIAEYFLNAREEYVKRQE